MPHNIDEALKTLQITQQNSGVAIGSNWLTSQGGVFESVSPVDGSVIGTITSTDLHIYEQVITDAENAFKEWRIIPAPQRGEIIRQFGEELRKVKQELGMLVSYEMGKSLQEGLGEVQEMIDICDFAVGLSRQLYGLTMHSERPNHRMYEQWHPLGIVGIISAFNFPVAVWAWNAAIAWVCGDVCVWKPSEKSSLSAVACQKIVQKVFDRNNVPAGVSCLVAGDSEIGQKLAADNRVPLISATGSTKMGKKVGEVVGARLGKHILELGGNNAIIISNHADLELVIPGAVFGAVGTAGQRCTSTRRLIIHEEIYAEVKEKLAHAYGQLKIGDPLDETNHVGPLIDKDAVKMYLDAIKKVKEEGGSTVVEGEVLNGEGYESGCYVKPAIYEAEPKFDIVCNETFAPILYLLKYKMIEEAV
ncbi:MAG: aldehyde dehydrogenase family protein, partial [Bacteroidota bacterium]